MSTREAGRAGGPAQRPGRLQLLPGSPVPPIQDAALVHTLTGAPAEWWSLLCPGEEARASLTRVDARLCHINCVNSGFLQSLQGFPRPEFHAPTPSPCGLRAWKQG